MNNRPEQGFVLIAVLWLIALFAIVALGYARTTRYKTQEVVNELQLLHDERILDSALEVAAAQYELYLANRAQFLSLGLENSLTPEQRSVMWYPRHEPYVLRLEQAELFVRLTPLDGLLALHALTPDLWFRVLGACGVDNEETRLEIMAAVADWEDADDLLHLGGAEAEYYAGLPTPYACKNAPLERLEELLLVRGITPEFFYGTADHPGLRHFLCLEGDSTRLDINSVSLQTLNMVESLSVADMEAIAALRQENPIVDMAEVFEAISLVAASELDRFFHVLHNPAAIVAQVAHDPDPGPGVRVRTRIFYE